MAMGQLWDNRPASHLFAWTRWLTVLLPCYASCTGFLFADKQSTKCTSDTPVIVWIISCILRSFSEISCIVLSSVCRTVSAVAWCKWNVFIYSDCVIYNAERDAEFGQDRCSRLWHRISRCLIYTVLVFFAIIVTYYIVMRTGRPALMPSSGK